MIATSCEDTNIRIFYIAASTDNPLRVFKGIHARRYLMDDKVDGTVLTSFNPLDPRFLKKKIFKCSINSNFL